MMRGFCQGTFDRPAGIKPFPDKSRGFSNALCPFRYTQGFVADSNHSAIPPIARLLAHCCPAAVSGFVIAVAVFAINGGCFAGALAHIGKEVLERVPPAVANSDSATAVIVPISLSGNIATSNHIVPNAICVCPLSIPCMTVRSVAFTGNFVTVTAAGSREAIAKRQCSDSLFRSTLASAKPIQIAVPVLVRKSDNQPSTECSIRKIHSRHSILPKGAPIPAGQQRADRAAEVTGMGA